MIGDLNWKLHKILLTGSSIIVKISKHGINRITISIDNVKIIVYNKFLYKAARNLFFELFNVIKNKIFSKIR